VANLDPAKAIEEMVAFAGPTGSTGIENIVSTLSENYSEDLKKFDGGRVYVLFTSRTSRTNLVLFVTAVN
jgi:hypothetical protein